MLEDPDRVDEVLRSAVACVVTKDEHDRLSAFDAGADGWDRYLLAGVDVRDTYTGELVIAGGRMLVDVIEV